MCGLVGTAGNLNVNSDKAFKQLLKLDSIRGEDSTGVAFIPKHGHISIVKEVGHPYNLMQKPEFIAGMQKWNKVLIGHNRWATVGKINADNAHPFEFGDIIGAHNGTLRNPYILDDNNILPVDSMALFNTVNNQGIKKAIKNLNGAWALSWWDNADGTLNFLRNKERPLWMVLSEDENLLFWASEKWMLHVALPRADIKMKDPFELPEDTHLSIRITKTGKLDDWKEEVLKSEFIPFQQGTANGFSGKKTKVSHTKPQQKGEVVPFKPNLLTQETVDRLKAGQDGYADSKGINVTMVAVGLDYRGGKYLLCKDQNHPDKTIRFYVNGKDVAADYLRKDYIVDIGKLFWNHREGLYYKVEHSSVKEVKPAAELFPDSAGRYMNFKDWRDKYGDCSWCTALILPTDAHKFLNGFGEILCRDCCTDQEVLNYVNTN